MEHLTPKETAKFLHENPKALFIDCRSEMEFLFVGHPVGAQHVAWNDGPDWEINPHFVGQVKKAVGSELDGTVGWRIAVVNPNGLVADIVTDNAAKPAPAVTLTLSKSEGRLISSTAGPNGAQNSAPIFSSFGQNPNDFVNSDGLLVNDRPVLAKAQNSPPRP